MFLTLEASLPHQWLAIVTIGVFATTTSHSFPRQITVGSHGRNNPFRLGRVLTQREIALPVFPRGHGDDYHDDDEGDDDPPDISMSPQEFRYKMQQNMERDKDGNGSDIPSSIPSFGPGRGRSMPKVRSFGTKKSPGKDMASVFTCTSCGSEYVQWRGRCGTCLEWNTIQECRVRRKPRSIRPDEAGSIPPIFDKSRRNSFQRVGSSWLDGVGMDFIGGGPVRLTDVYEDILPSKIGSSEGWKDSYDKGLREQRTRVPDDPEMNAVLGGGIMPGSITLVGGDPGVGKSTLLLQMAGSIASLAQRSLQFQGIGMGPSKFPTTTSPESDGTHREEHDQRTNGPVLYVSGEENANQIASRALRLGIDDPELLLWCETDADAIADTVANAHWPRSPSSIDSDDTAGNAPALLSRAPSLVIIDSIQTMICDAAGASAAGGITQVRECVALFLRLAKSTGVPVILVGHVTKSGDVAGPRTVEHMVDCVLYLEGGGLMGGGDGASVTSLRVLRAAKNRFGSSEEVGVYQMDGGREGRLVPVSDPSSFFLSLRQDAVDSEGCAISVVLEGIRSMTVEVQALVSFSFGSNAYSGRRVVDGISTSRLLVILAVLQKRYGISLQRQDVYVNVVGGLNLGKGSKTCGSDLAVAIAVVSSLVGIPVRSDTAFAGEVGLLGELRPIHSLEKRVSEARRMGFSRIVTPAVSGRKSKSANKSPSPREVSAGGITQVMCENLLDAINCGLVESLPTVSTRNGPKLKRAKQSPDPRLRRERSDEIESLGLESDVLIIDDDYDDDENFK